MQPDTRDIVQIIVYRDAGSVEYLLLQRSPEDGGWWQPVTGHVEFGESEQEALLRELAEETGITRPKFVSQQIHSNPLDGGVGQASVYMVQADADAEIKLEPGEHVQYKWVNFEDALNLLKYDGNKDNLRRADALLAEAR